MTLEQIRTEAVRDGAELELRLSETVVKFWRRRGDWWQYRCADMTGLVPVERWDWRYDWENTVKWPSDEAYVIGAA